MVLTIFHWLLVISIILLPFSRKWVGSVWKWIFRLLKNIFQFAWSIFRKIAEFIWSVIIGILNFVWQQLFVRIIKVLSWLIPRVAYWLGWFFLESLKFLFNALRALVEILKP